MAYSRERFIDLGRRFLSISGDKNGEEAALESYSSLPRWMLEKSTIGWNEISGHRLVVILGEPGSGKTWELRHQAEVSSQKGRVGFFFSLERLVSSTELPFKDRNERKAFDEWITADSQAAFFLDAIDESKIRKVDDFYLALDRFRNAIGTRGLTRAWITISCRITEWLPSADYAAVRERLYLAANSSKDQKDESPFVVHILPLNENAVNTYASSRWEDDGIAFTKAIEVACASDFVRRPADIEDLFCYWKKYGQLGSLKEILTFVIDQQLDKPSSRDRSDPLSLERARAGAEYLAAATVFCRRFEFGVPNDDVTNANALDVRRCLPDDWQNQELRALLQRSVFDGASHGCIRFHHRRISEFLAAGWLSRLMASSCPILALDNLLMHIVRGRRLLRPSSAPVAAWLCAGSEYWNREVFRWIIKSSPESLLQWGDPAQLSHEQRLELLSSLKLRVTTRERYWWTEDRAALKRLATNDLEEEINRLLRDLNTPSDLQNFVIDMAEAGCLRGCADAIRDVAINEIKGKGDFLRAIHAIEQFGDSEILRSIVDAISKRASLTPREFATVALAAYPGVWRAEEFVQLFQKVLPHAEWSGWPYSLQQRLKEIAATSPDGCKLLLGLSNGFPSDEDASEQIEENLSRHSLSLILAVCEGMLARHDLDEREQIALGTALGRVSRRAALGHYVMSEIKWDELIGERFCVRRAYFERAAEKLAERLTDRFPSFGSISIYYESLRLNAKDLSWILEKLSSADSAEEREQAWQWAIEAWGQFGRPRSVRKQIMASVACDARLASLSQKVFHPGLRGRTIGFWNRYLRRYFYRHTWYSRRYRMVKQMNAWRAAYYFWRHRDQLRSGKNIGWLMHIAYDSARHENSSHLTASDWAAAKQRWGKRVAMDARLGCKRMWRKYMPQLPSESASNNDGISYSVITGLAGIMAEWEDGEIDFANLSSNEIEQVIRYALNEINGFPPWIADLVKKQPDQIRKVVLSECAKELAAPANMQVYRVVQRISWNEELKWPQMQNDILALSEIQNVQNIEVLEDILKILCRIPTTVTQELTDTCQRVIATLSPSAKTFPYWMATWLQLDALCALNMLTEQLETSPDAQEVMEKICVLLRGDRLKVTATLPETSWLVPDAARKFIPLVYKWIHPDQDICEQGVVGHRQHAQDFRHAMVELFAQNPSGEVASVLEELQANPDLAGIKSYLGNLIERSYGVVADGVPWKEADVLSFAREYEVKPKNQYDLFRLALHRLDDLKREVEKSENSPRSELREANDEEGARRWFARKLRDKSKNIYEVPQESEIDGRARIDLRITVPGISPVPIELKVLDKGWTIPDLLQSLEHQLVGTYLRDSNTHYGIFLLIRFKEKKWRDTDGSPVSLEQLLAILQKKSADLVSTGINVRGLEIIAIDFIEPTSWRNT